jgi:hypothetical protein
MGVLSACPEALARDETCSGGHLTRLSALPVLTDLMSAPLRFSKVTPTDSPEPVSRPERLGKTAF